MNTLQRHKPKCGPDTTLIFGARGLGTLSISSLSEAYYEDDIYSRFSNGDFDDYMNDVSTVGSTEANVLSNDHNPPSYTNSNLEDEKTGLELWIESGGGSELVDGDTICLCMNNKETNDSSSDNLSFDVVREKDATDSIGDTEILNPFSDLTGDYDAHIRNLLYGQGCHGYALSSTMVRISPPTSPYGNTNVWDPAAHSWLSQQNSGSRVNGNANGVVLGHPTYLNGTNRTPANVALRGTGPYIPVVVCSLLFIVRVFLVVCFSKWVKTVNFMQVSLVVTLKHFCLKLRLFFASQVIRVLNLITEVIFLSDPLSLVANFFSFTRMIR